MLQQEFSKADSKFKDSRMTHTVVSSWYDRPGYVESMAGLIKEQVRRREGGEEEKRRGAFQRLEEQF